MPFEQLGGLPSNRTIAIVSQGLFERSDSIGYDAVFQARVLEKIYPGQVRVFSERFNQSLYPDINIEPISLFFSSVDDSFITIYHYCDGWPAFDEFIERSPIRVILRWHNNTPPWFYIPEALRFAERSVRGFQTIAGLCEHAHIFYWVNSDYTAQQLQQLGGDPDRIRTVLPASRYLDASTREASAISTGMPDAHPSQDEIIRLLFVSRVVPHKGHFHIMRVADILAKRHGVEVEVHFAGRRDEGMRQFNAELNQRAQASSARIVFHGEIDEAQLSQLYATSTTYLCMSEHEGFGLPIFEAMHVGLPVVARATTALIELTKDHPLCFVNGTDAQLAEAILATRNEVMRSRVIELQHRIASDYSTSVITKQILGISSADKMFRLKGDAALVSGEISRWLLNLKNSRSSAGHQINPDCVDDPYRFVTSYDLKAYDYLLSNQIGKIDLSREFDGFREIVWLSAAKFDFLDIHTDSNGLLINGLRRRLGHIIYGPFAPCDHGRYEVIFHFDVKDVHQSGRVGIDVCGEGDNILASRRINVRRRGKLAASIPFTVERDRDRLEFRVAIVREGSYLMYFKGVSIRQAQAKKSRFWRLRNWDK
ncbi:MULTISPECIES: glycosyltransferase family 4 protein [unclassified Sphingobium]|uniref:glycosyltransferase family 4 protein n=1 Tax=unclassified Sphingobium TaxID=2611147 RepID=UPI000AC4D7AC|nr:MULTISPECIES: glycosyltransferase family 4 protein [unclassified Sphingobium]